MAAAVSVLVVHADQLFFPFRVFWLAVSDPLQLKMELKVPCH
jgi:hypothetical protein